MDRLIDYRRLARPNRLPQRSWISILVIQTSRTVDFRLISDFQKFCLPTDPNQFTDSPCPDPQRGVSRTSRTRVGDAVDAAASGARKRAGRMMLMRTAKSCGSDAPMLASSLREEAQATVSNKPGHRGEREVSRKTIARGMPGLLRCTCGDYTRVLTTHCTRGCGCIGHPAFLRPLFIEA